MSAERGKRKTFSNSAKVSTAVHLRKVQIYSSQLLRGGVGMAKLCMVSRTV